MVFSSSSIFFTSFGLGGRDLPLPKTVGAQVKKPSDSQTFFNLFWQGKTPAFAWGPEVLLSRALCAVLLASGGCVSFAFDLLPYQVRCGATEGEHNYKDSEDGVQ